MRIFKLDVPYLSAKVSIWDGKTVGSEWTRTFWKGALLVELGAVWYRGDTRICVVIFQNYFPKGGDIRLFYKSAWLRFRNNSTMLWDYDRHTDKEHRLDVKRIELDWKRRYARRR